jgi:hypothetical protein
MFQLTCTDAQRKFRCGMTEELLPLAGLGFY